MGDYRAFRQLQRADGAWEESGMSLQIGPEDIPERKESPLLSKRGRFKLSRELIRTDAHNLAPLFSRVIVLEAEIRWECDCVEYLALSDLFGELPEGVMA